MKDLYFRMWSLPWTNNRWFRKKAPVDVLAMWDKWATFTNLLGALE